MLKYYTLKYVKTVCWNVLKYYTLHICYNGKHLYYVETLYYTIDPSTRNVNAFQTVFEIWWINAIGAAHIYCYIAKKNGPQFIHTLRRLSYIKLFRCIWYISQVCPYIFIHCSWHAYTYQCVINYVHVCKHEARDGHEQFVCMIMRKLVTYI